jgi:hypothetical protein
MATTAEQRIATKARLSGLQELFNARVAAQMLDPSHYGEQPFERKGWTLAEAEQRRGRGLADGPTRGAASS